jgi:hypothetical protein
VLRSCLFEKVVRDYTRSNYDIERTGMATDYDAPRKNDDDHESIEAIKERIPEKSAGSTDVDDGDHGISFLGPESIQEDLEVVVLPAQDDEFTCSQCFIVKHHSLLSRKKKTGPVCVECD